MKYLMTTITATLLFFYACKGSKPKENYSEPKATSFWYYQPEFQLSKQENKLATEGLYFRIIKADAFGELYKLFRFYEEGLVIAYIVYNTPDKVNALPKESIGNIHGYYTVKSDSLFFTTKVYYNHQATFYKGQVFEDSLVLDQVNYQSKQEARHTYYRYRD